MQGQAVIARAAGAIQAQVDGDTVLLSPIDFSYHALDPVGACIWEFLEQPQTIDQIVEALLTLYAVDEATCRADIAPFIERMIEIGAMTLSE